jgi:hypothetical protein
MIAGLLWALQLPGQAQKPPAEPKADYAATVRPLVVKFCQDCHSTKEKKGSLDLERFAAEADLRKDLKVWVGVIEQLEAGEMPPKGKPQPTAEERQRLIAWIQQFLDAEARSRSGDPGHVPLRRLSNAEYDATIRDLTGVELKPAREFPADGAAGEGFTNAAEALTEISPALLTKYLAAAKGIADHLVLLPDGFRFSPATTRRDWTNEGTARLRRFYADILGGDGRLPVQPYLAATVRHRAVIEQNPQAIEGIAAKEKLNAKYLGILWQTLNDKTPSQPLDELRAKWRTAKEQDGPALAAIVASWQATLWKTVKVGNYVQASWHVPGGYVESLSRQVAVDPSATEAVQVNLGLKPVAGQLEVVLRLEARDLSGTPSGRVIWQRPRFEGPGKPALLLRDYEQFGPAFEIDVPTAFAQTQKYLDAVVALANAPGRSVAELAKERSLNAAYLLRWVELLAVPARKKAEPAKTTPAIPLTLLEEKTPDQPQWPTIKGWRKKGTSLPSLVSNSSDTVLQIPGRVVAHGISMHPMPKEFVAVAWKSPIEGELSLTAKVAHAHPTCGNGIAWWIEHRREGRATALGEGTLDLGKEIAIPAKTIAVQKGDTLVLAVDARNGDHSCDMTEIAFTLRETGGAKRVWDLAKDVADTIGAGNPHSDQYKNPDTWSFGFGPSQGSTTAANPAIPVDSALGRWRVAAGMETPAAELAKLAAQVETLLRGPRPAAGSAADRLLYDKLVSFDSPLFAGVDVRQIAQRRQPSAAYGFPKARFGQHPDQKPLDDTSLIAAVKDAVEIRLPAALFNGRVFLVEAKLDGPAGERVVQVRATLGGEGSWVPNLLGSAESPAYKRRLQGVAEFRRVFPLFLAFPQVVPTDEVVTLKMFHREDEPLIRLFLTEEQARQLDKLWAEQRFISRQPVAEFDYLPQFMGYTTQDTPKAFQQFFIDRKPTFQKHAEAFLKEEEAAIPKHLNALAGFAERAYRRPLTEKEKAELLGLYRAIRAKQTSHDEALRGTLARVLVAPAFLFRIEQSPAGKDPTPVSDWELATRLSYFLWSSMPDDELLRLAAAGQLRNPKTLAAQVERMLQDPKARSLAIEFGTQWLHVRGFDEFNEKNEKLFPAFTPDLRKAMNEEAILFFLDLFQNNRPVRSILDADHVFVNDMLAKHYGIPGVNGPQWRRVDGVRKYGRGGVLGFASVQTKHAGASRTSPVLRGNWVVETLLGEKLPRPPKNVPQLPEAEGSGGKTMRQQVETHAKAPQCASCHVRIDPFGFALEQFDPIGRLRKQDLGGLPVDTHAKLRDGSEFDGIDGLRAYLLNKKLDGITRLFGKRLLGYALGRSTTLSDTLLLDEIAKELSKNGGKVQAAIQAIVRSPQFRMVRGRDAAE